MGKKYVDLTDEEYKDLTDIDRSQNRVEVVMIKIIYVYILMIMSLSIEAKEVLIDANGNNNKDLVIYNIISMKDNPDLDEPYLQIKIKTNTKDYLYNGIWIQYPIIQSCGKGCIELKDERGEYLLVNSLKYTYHKLYDDWLHRIKCNNNQLCYFENLNNMIIPNDTLIEFEKKLSLNYTNLAMNITIKYLSYYLKQKPITKQTLTKYNNIAYYLQKAGANKEAIFILEKILSKYPNRTVAHYNIADAYWDTNDKEKAIKHYKIYVKQMKQKGKQKKIPNKIIIKLQMN